MKRILSHLETRRGEMAAMCRQFAECESPSDDPAALARFAALVSEKVKDLGRVRTLPGGHLECEFESPGAEKDGQILCLGHLDTVWPVGTLARMPVREEDGRLYGPGLLDMKTGIVLLIHAVRALRELNVAMRRRVVMQLNADEETGSDSSRPLTEEQARRSAAVLVIEPGEGPEGKLKTARKGVGQYTIVVHGKAAHSGLDPTKGASAIVELARQIGRIAAFTRLEDGVTVNPGLISGGVRVNVVAPEARVDVDARVVRAADAPALDREFRALRPFDERCRIEIAGGLERPPMERTPAGAALFEKARALAAEMGIALEETLSGGGSDGNFTAGVGAPTLDGLGAVGEGAHAAHEHIILSRLPDRAALIAGLLTNL
jgi:glutamate carboxypeptidase